MKHLLPITLFLLPGVALAMSSKPSEPEPVPAQGRVNFIAIGDTGTGEHGQYLVAAAMKDVCALYGCEFALGLGDNIYDSGVDSAADIQFELKFEDPYSNLDFPFYMTLGNHDNGWFSGDGLDNDKGEYQVEYHYKQDRPSNKWQMPARYYRFTAPLNSSTPLISFYSLDSNPLAAISDTDPEYRMSVVYREQEAWLEQQLATDTAPWKIAFSHHPFRSNGQHGNAGLYDGIPGLGYAWYDLIRDNLCGRMNLMVSGHDHDLQVLEPASRCDGMTQIVSGAGAKYRPLKNTGRNDAYFQQGDTLGFMHLSIEGDTLNLKVITVNDVSGEWQIVHQQTISR